MIESNVRKLLDEIPPGVDIVAAAKTRSASEITCAVKAGVKIIGENYAQELLEVYDAVKEPVLWHFIGHIQTNKVRQIVEKVDMIETLDSMRLAREIDKRCAVIGKVMPVLVEINIARESEKSGARPEDTEDFVRALAVYKNIEVKGLMTMGPPDADGEEARSYFRQARVLFDKIKNLALKGADMKYLSMGMTSSYMAAVEEGANLVRIGTKIFGERNYD
ncbi:YggS family pyridoxal phosphate-dependent enzyme [bacterium]|nr:YggS family pyridoxal phosphate-dependent enzyme [bacterium]MBU3956544.1 YggS family pyridoxal phosphate-dependent enzyme [bacterium]MBU4134661.1 YggS family pyridoxal phosphate-dependent enzyme [bacterium]